MADYRLVDVDALSVAVGRLVRKHSRGAEWITVEQAGAWPDSFRVHYAMRVEEFSAHTPDERTEYFLLSGTLDMGTLRSNAGRHQFVVCPSVFPPPELPQP